jgi:hypothetical protein
MRFPGENAGGQAAARRRRPSGRDAASQPGRRAGAGNEQGQPGGESSLFIPGYRDGRQSAAEQGGHPPRPGSQYGWAGSAAGKGPVRGFPPAPGQPPPLYPPGQFSAWNRASRADQDDQADDPWAGLSGQQAGYPMPDETGSGHLAAAGTTGRGHPDAGFAPGYSDLAVSDPAADATSTQTWGAVGGDGIQADSWTSQRAPADGRPPAGPRQQPSVRAGDAGGPHGPALGYFAPADGAGALGTQPGRAPGQSTGARSTGGRGTGGHGTRTAPRPRRKPSRLLLAAGLAVLVAVSGGTYVLLRGGHSPAAAAAKPKHPAASASPSAASPSPTPTLGRWGHIASRAADPQPLTLAEIFPVSFSAGAAYHRTIRRQGKNCPAAVVGPRLQHAVRRPECSQVLRASYLSVSKKLMGTIGVLNLRTFKSAENAGKAAGPGEFIAQLAAAKGPTRNLTKGTGIEQAVVKGHYLILVWAEFTTLHKPTKKKQRKQLEAFLSLLIGKTANVSLTSRMVTGKPPP